MTRLPVMLALALLLVGCDLSMTQQRKYKTYAPAPLWANASSAQPLPDGVVAAGDAERRNAEVNPPPVSDALLARERERFDIFCAPCHGLAGDGEVSVISLFDGCSCALFDGRMGCGSAPDATERAAVLAAVKDATRRWRGGPKTGHP